MQREWYLIDDEGIHALDMGSNSGEFWGQFRHPGEDAPWPPFSQLVFAAAPDAVMAAMERTGPQLGLRLQDVTQRPERWSQAVVVAEGQDLTMVAEPAVDLDERVVALPWAEALAAQLGCSGAFFGYDPAASTLYLTQFEAGEVTLAWSDSLMPGPSYAWVFDDQGRVQDQDPRKFALERMGLPETSPLVDRYAFLEMELGRHLGLETISPDLEAFPVAGVVEVEYDEEQGASGEEAL